MDPRKAYKRFIRRPFREVYCILPNFMKDKNKYEYIKIALLAYIAFKGKI